MTSCMYLKHQIKGTVWKELDEEKLYKQLDLKDFELNFSAYQKQEDPEALNRSLNSSKAKGEMTSSSYAFKFYFFVVSE